MVSIITAFAMKYAQVLITAGIGIVIRAAEISKLVTKYQAQISALIKDIKDASNQSNTPL